MPAGISNSAIYAAEFATKAKKKAKMPKMNEFCEETSLAGFKYLTGHQSWSRKIIWLVLLIGASTIMFLQLYDKYKDFTRNPITTNIDINYPDNLTFPAIALCNNNLFKISAALKYENYDMLQDIYGGAGSTISTKIDYSKYKHTALAKLLNSRDFHMEMMSKMNEMLISCYWPDKTPCVTSDFKLMFTDYGVCYAINHDKHNPKIVDAGGADSGMYMLLNIEEYEAMAGPSLSTGMKVVLFNQTNIPMVGAHAIEVPPGFLSQIGVGHIVRDRIHKDSYGSCVYGKSDMNYYRTDTEYSVERCTSDLHWRKIAQDCKCDAYNAPTDCLFDKSTNKLVCTSHKELTVCTSKDHFQCVLPHYGQRPKGASDCAANCTTIQHKSTLSMSKLPETTIQSAISSKRLQDLTSTYQKAIEARYRLQKSKKAQVEKLISDLNAQRTNAKNKGFEPIRPRNDDDTSRFRTGLSRVREAQCFQNITKSASYARIAKYLEGEDKLEIEDETVYRIMLKSMGFSDNEIVYVKDNVTDNDTMLEAFTKITTELGEFNDFFNDLWSLFNEKAYAIDMQKTVEEYDRIKTAVDDYQANKTTIIELANLMKSNGQVSSMIMQLVNYFGDMQDGDKWMYKVNNLASSCGYRPGPQSGPLTSCYMKSFVEDTYMLTLLNSSLVYGSGKDVAVSFAQQDATCGQTVIGICSQYSSSEEQSGENNDQPVSGSTSVTLGSAAVGGEGAVTSATTANGAMVSTVNADTTTTVGAGATTGTTATGGGRVTTTRPPSPLGRRKREAESFQQASAEIDWKHCKDGLKMKEDAVVMYSCDASPDADFKQLIIDMNDCVINELLPMAEKFMLEAKAVTLSLNAAMDNLAYFSMELLEHSTPDTDFYASNMVGLNIYYKDLSSEHFSQELAYTLSSFAADIGGTVGLFLGASIMAVGELIDFFLIRPLIAVCSK